MIGDQLSDVLEGLMNVVVKGGVVTAGRMCITPPEIDCTEWWGEIRLELPVGSTSAELEV